MARQKKWEYCTWCMTKVKPPTEVCDECMPDWLECEKQLEPAREKVQSLRMEAAVFKVKHKERRYERDQLNAEIHKLESEMEESFAKALEIENAEMGSWECKHSPTKLCVYNPDEDVCLDRCLICGQPDERK